MLDQVWATQLASVSTTLTHLEYEMLLWSPECKIKKESLANTFKTL